MLYPTIFNDSLFDELMDLSYPVIRGLGEADKKLFGKNAAHIMRTDIHEHESGYEIDIDLPGFKKDEITLELENGYLTVGASKGLEKNEEDGKRRVIRQERYSGAMQRSFFVGRNLTEEDIKAKFEDGVLHLELPKAEAKQLPEKKTIMIEG